MPKLTIDGIEVEVAPGTSVLQAAEQIGIEIPRFCFHDRLSVPANCRMCLVEVERAPKPMASCAMVAADNMVVRTNSEKVRNSRRGVMEFLLINHPLDCPICDQGGECDLQDQAMAYGFDRGRFLENKRAVKDKNLGPLIKTIMTRCIHCTRCVRFADEIAGVPDLGMLNRGEDSEITTGIEQAVASELSGNMIDICPVGALTSKPYAFNARPWELKKTESIDVMDAVGSNIRVDCRGPEVLRVLPRLNEDVNEEWISDKTRFAYDGLKRQRLDRPYVRRDGKLVPASWPEAFAAITEKLGGLAGERIAAITGDLVDAESTLALKDLMQALGSPHLECRQDGATFDVTQPAGWTFNSTIAGIDEADAILLVGTNPRKEAAVLNARIRKRYLAGDVKIGVIGEQATLTYAYDYLGAGARTLSDLAEGSHPFADALKSAERPMLILGQGALRRPDGLAIHALCHKIADATGMIVEDWNGFNMLHAAAGRVGALKLGFVPQDDGRDLAGIYDGVEAGEIDAVYLLGADEIDTARLAKAFVIYQGHHGDRGAAAADVILPGAAYTEKHGIYVNTEGRAQIARAAAFPLGEAREDWKILRALSEPLGARLPYDSLAQIRRRLADADPCFAVIGSIQAISWTEFGRDGACDDAPFASAVDVFYMTDPISRASATMAKCVETFLADTTGKTGTDG